MEKNLKSLENKPKIHVIKPKLKQSDRPGIEFDLRFVTKPPYRNTVVQDSSQKFKFDVSSLRRKILNNHQVFYI
jgi:hypothetical protein